MHFNLKFLSLPELSKTEINPCKISIHSIRFTVQLLQMLFSLLKWTFITFKGPTITQMPFYDWILVSRWWEYLKISIQTLMECWFHSTFHNIVFLQSPSDFTCIIKCEEMNEELQSACLKLVQWKIEFTSQCDLNEKIICIVPLH